LKQVSAVTIYNAKYPEELYVNKVYIYTVKPA